MLTKIDAARCVQKQEGWVIFGYFAGKQYNRYARKLAAAPAGFGNDADG